MEPPNENEKNKKEKCQWCPYKGRPDNVKKHIQTKHLKMFSFFCECGLKFTTSTARNRHQKYNCNAVKENSQSIESHASTENHSITGNLSENLPSAENQTFIESHSDNCDLIDSPIAIDFDKIAEANISIKTTDGSVFVVPITIDKIPRVLAVAKENDGETILNNSLNSGTESTDQFMSLTPAPSPLDNNSFDFNSVMLGPNSSCKQNDQIMHSA